MEEELKDRLCKKLPPAFKKKLVTALRSGEFKKCNSTLHRFEGGQHSYCVMGVVHKLLLPGEPSGGNISRSQLNKEEYLEKIPSVFLKDDGSQPSLVQTDLISKNDNGWSFKKLATYISKNL